MRNFITKSLILYINLENNNLSGGMVVAGFESLPVCKQQKNRKKMEKTERNIETTYLKAVNWLHNSRILCNDICNIDELFWDNCRFELEEGDEIFQFFLTNCSTSDVEFLEKHFGLLFAYSELLNLYVLCVDHYGTSWDCVTCYTDIEMAKNK